MSCQTPEPVEMLKICLVDLIRYDNLCKAFSSYCNRVLAYSISMLHEYYVGHCPMSKIYLMYTLFWNLALLSSSGDLTVV